MEYCDTSESAIETSIHRDIVTRWVGDPAELIAHAQERGYEVDSVDCEEQTGDDEYRTYTDVWGWSGETPDGEQDWRVYVEQGG